MNKVLFLWLYHCMCHFQTRSSTLTHSILLGSLLMFVVPAAHAQLCNGSLGDPVVNITFGAGPNPGAPLAAASTGYQYKSADCPQDGLYTVANSTQDCFGNTWHNLSQDHTGNANGYFMLINASEQPGDFYLDTVHTLCANTTYEFAAWVMNVLVPSACDGNGKKPNITFSLETTTGTVLKTYNTGDIPSTQSPVWNQYGFFFTTPATIPDVVLRMTNNAPGGCGNDLAIDDITFRPCGPQIDATLVGGDINNTGNVCIGKDSVFNFDGNVSAGYTNPVFQWQVSKDKGNSWADIIGANTTAFTHKISAGTPAGTYLFRLSVSPAINFANVKCRTSSHNITINVLDLPHPFAGNNGPICDGKTLILQANSTNKNIWTGPAGFNSNGAQISIPSASFGNAGKYYVFATSPGGCVNTDSTVVQVNPDPIASIDADATICENASVVLHANGGVTYAWQPASSLDDAASPSPKATPKDSTTYTAIVFNAFHCADTATMKVNVLRNPIANAGPDKKIMEGQSVMLNGSAGGTNISFSWTPTTYMDNPFTLSPSVSPTIDFTYSLEVNSNFGCPSAKDDVFVRVFEKIEIPNAFSPNGDGINDTWNIKNLITYPEADLDVFNRNGQPVYHSHGYPKPWDGTYNGNPIPVGTYYFVLDIKNDFPKQTGWVFIVR